MSRSHQVLSLLLAGVLGMTLAGCTTKAPPASAPVSTDGPAEDPGDDTVDPPAERLAWHVDAYDDQVIPFASNDFCGGDWPFQSGMLMYPTKQGPVVGATVPSIQILDTDTDSPIWSVWWDTSDDPYTNTHYQGGGTFTFEYGPDGQPTGGLGADGWFETTTPDGMVTQETDYVRIIMTRAGPEPEQCLQLEAQGYYKYF